MDGYSRLIVEFCASQGIEDVNDLLHRGLLEVGNLPMRVEYLPSTDQCRIFADFGQVPDGQEAEFHEFLLESNFDGDAGTLPVLSLHPDTGHVVLAVHLSMGRLQTAGGLMGAIREHVLPIADWWSEVVQGEPADAGETYPSLAPLTGAYV